MSFGAALFGNAAVQFEESRFKWQQLFEERAARKEARDLAERQIKAQQDLEQTRFENQKSILEIQDEINDENASVQYTQEIGMEALRFAETGAYGTSELRELVGTFSENPHLKVLVPVLEGFYRDGIFNSPEDALTVLNNAVLDPLNYNTANVNLALSALEGFLGDDFTAYKKEFDALLLENTNRAKEGHELETEKLQNQNDLLLAQKGFTTAQTAASEGAESRAVDLHAGNLDAQKLALQKAGFEVDQIEFLVTHMLPEELNNLMARTAGIEVETATSQYSLDHLLPEQKRLIENQIEGLDLENLKSGIDLQTFSQRTWLALRREELEVSQLEDTYDAIVGLAFAELEGAEIGNEISRSELELSKSNMRVALATEGSRIAIIRGDAAAALKNVELIDQQIKESIERIHSSQASTTRNNAESTVRIAGLQQELELAAVDMIRLLVDSGDTEMMNSVGLKLLETLDIQNPNEVLGRLKDKALDNLNEAEQIALIELELLKAERDIAQWEAEHQDEIFELNDWATREGVAINWATLNFQKDSFQKTHNHRISEYEDKEDKTKTPDDVYDVTGINRKDFRDRMDALIENAAELQDPYTREGEGNTLRTENAAQLAVLVGYTQQYIAAARSMGFTGDNILPPELQNESGLTMEILKAAGIVEPEPSLIDTIDVTDTDEVAEVLHGNFVDPSGDVDYEGVENTSFALWSSMSDSEKAEFTDNEGIPSFNLFHQGTTASLEEITSENRVIRGLTASINSTIPQLYPGAAPAQGESFTAAQRADILVRSGQDAAAIENVMADVGRVLDATGADNFISFSAEHAQILRNAAELVGMPLMPNGLPANNHMLLEALRERRQQYLSLGADIVELHGAGR